MKETDMNKCSLCPRVCGVDRTAHTGFCGGGDYISVARIAPHFWEEPCITGSRGAGTVFFGGCSLKCVFCQNFSLSHENLGKKMEDEDFRQALKRLEKQGVHNIDLVNPTHYADILARIFEKEKPSVPVVYNSGGFDSIEALKRADTFADVYLPDFKLMDESRCKRYLGFEEYGQYAKKAIAEMIRQKPKPIYNDEGLLVSGVLIRHLVIPCNLDQTKKIIDWLGDNVPDDTPISLMGQYVPAGKAEKYSEINRKLTEREYNRAVERFLSKGFKNGYIQELSSGSAKYIPAFDFTGVNGGG